MTGYFVQTLADGSLKVWEQPRYLFGSIFAIPALAATVFFAYRTYKTKSLIGIPFIAAALIFFVMSLRIMRSFTVIFDRSRNLVTVRDPATFGYDSYTVPMDSIRYADVTTGHTTSALMLLTKDGDRLQMGDLNQTTGKGRAAHAINVYLGVPDR